MKAIDVGAFEAKTQFSRLLRDVANGAVVHIHRRGEWVADLVGPTDSTERQERGIKALERIRSRRDKLGIKEINELRETGRER